MLRENDRLAVTPAEPPRDLARQAELLARPGGSEPDELPEPARRVGEVGFQQAVELQERFLVESDGIEVFRCEPRLVEAIADGVRGERRVMLHAGEAFLLRRRHDVALDHQRRCRIVVVGRDAEHRGHQNSV